MAKVWVKLEQKELDDIAKTVTNELADIIRGNALNNDFIPSIYDFETLNEMLDECDNGLEILVPLKRRVKNGSTLAARIKISVEET